MMAYKTQELSLWAWKIYVMNYQILNKIHESVRFRTKLSQERLTCWLLGSVGQLVMTSDSASHD